MLYVGDYDWHGGLIEESAPTVRELSTLLASDRTLRQDAEQA